jgi:putative lipoprotein
MHRLEKSFMKTATSRIPLSRRRLMILAAAALVLPAQALAAGRSLAGKLSYRERIALPPEALLEVRLVDVSLADAPARSLAATRVKTRHRLPIPYRLRFDAAKILPGHAYALEARITVKGKLWFTTTARHAVFTGKPDETDIRVELVKSASAAPLPWNGRWLTESIRNRGVIDDLQTVLEIAADGKVSGSSGCNRISGKMTIDGAHMSFGPIASTRMACAPAIMDQESKFLAALGATRSWQIDEQQDKLILIDAQGVTVLRLARM